MFSPLHAHLLALTPPRGVDARRPLDPSLQRRYADAMRVGIGAVQAKLPGACAIGVQRAGDLGTARRQVEFLAHLHALLGDRPPGRVPANGILVTTAAGAIEAVDRRLTVPLGGERDARALAEDALSLLIAA